MLGVLLAGFAAVVAACGGASHSITTARLGAVYEAKPATCPISFENMPADEAMQKYEALGQIVVMDATALTPEVKKDVVAEACKMGADVVTFGASAGTSMMFMPFRHR